MATNSEQARVFNGHSLNCQLLLEHSGMWWCHVDIVDNDRTSLSVYTNVLSIDIILSMESMDCSSDGIMLVTSSKVPLHNYCTVH